MLKLRRIRSKLHRPASFTQNRVAFALKTATILAATLTVFFQDLILIFSGALQNGTTSYILAVPFILTYLIYRKRKMLRAVMPLTVEEQPPNTRHLASIAGMVLAAAALLLHSYGSLATIEYHTLALPLFLAGMCLILFNFHTLRQLAFPVAFLLFLTPPPPEIAQVLGFVVFATLVAYLDRDKLWKKIALLITGIPIIYILNIAKTYATFSATSYQSSGLTQQMFQSLAGWLLIFLETLLLLTIAETIFKTHVFFVKTADECPQCNQKPASDRDYCQRCDRILTPEKMKLRKSDTAKLAAIILVALLLVTVQAPVFAVTEGLPTVTINTFSGTQGSSQILPQTDQYTLEFLQRDTQFESRGKQDIGLDYEYTPLNQSNQPINASVGIAPAQSSLIRWETALTPPKYVTIDLRDISLVQTQVTSHYFVFNNAEINKIQAVLYWFETTAFMVNSTWQEEYVEISLVAFPQTIDQLLEVERELVALATAITGYWQPITAWSETTMLLAQNSIIVLTATGITLTLITTYQWIEARKRKKVSLTAAEKLSSSNREIVKAIQETQNPATIENVAAMLRTSIGRTVTTEQLEETLRELEKTGAVRSSVYNQNDEPIQTWKT